MTFIQPSSTCTALSWYIRLGDTFFTIIQKTILLREKRLLCPNILILPLIVTN